MDTLARPRRPKASRWRRFASGAWRGGLIAALLLVAVPPALLVALRFAAPRALVARKVDRALATLFRGRLHLTTIERVDLGGARVTGSIDDPAGRRVIRFQSVTVRLDVPRLLLELVHGGGLRTLTIDEVRIPHAEVALIDDGQGAPTLAHTFDPRTPSPPGTTSGPAPTLTVRSIRVEHAWVHGRLASSPLLDADVAQMSASLGLDQQRFRLEVTGGRLTGRLEPAAPNAEGKLTGSLHVPLGPGALGGKVGFDGTLAGTAVTATAAIEGAHLTADAQLPDVRGEAVARVVPGLVMRGSTRVVAHAEGTLPELTATVRAAGDAGELDAQAKLALGTPLRVNAHATGKRLDASAVVPSAPETRLALDANLALASDGGVTQGSYDVALHEPSVAKQGLPDLTARGKLRSAGSTLTLDGDLAANEPGTRAEVSYAVRLANGTGSADVAVRAELADSPRLVAAAGVRTRGKLTAHATGRFPNPTLAVLADLRLEGVEHGADRLGPTSAHVELEGTAVEPRFSAKLVASRGVVAGRELREIRAEMSGSPAAARVTAAATGARNERLVATSDVRSARGVVTLDHTSAMYRDADGALLVTLSRATFAGSRIQVDDFSLRGAGEASASFSVDGSRFHVSGRTERLELVRLARLARVSTPLERGYVTVAVDARREPSLEARAEGTLDGLDYGTVKGGSTSFVLATRDEQWSGQVVSELVPGSRVVVELRELAVARLLARPPLLPEGELRASGELDLSCMTPLLAAIPGLPVEEAKGTVNLRVDYRRDDLGAFPALTARVRTHALGFVEKRQPGPQITSRQQAIEAAPSVYSGINVALDLALDEPSRRLTAHVDLHDDRTALVTADATAGPWPADAPSDLGASLLRLPLELTARLPERRLASLPPPVRPVSLRGTVAGDLTFHGSIMEPHLTLDVRAGRLGVAAERVRGEPKPRVALLLHAEYEPTGGELLLAADAKSGRVVDSRYRWTGDLLRAVRDPATRNALLVTGEAKLDRLDLESIAPLKNRQIEGIVSGTVKVEYGADRRLAFVDLVAAPLRLGQLTIDRLNVTLDAQPGGLRGAVNAEGQSGVLRASVTSGLDWPARGAPNLAGDIVAALSARKFRLATLWPLTASVVNELDGRLDAELGARVQNANVTLSGHGELRGGIVQVPAVGQRLTDISARIAVAPGAIVIDQLEGRGVTGRFVGDARLAFDEHLALHQLDAQLEIPKRDKLPVTVSGAEVGDAYGKVEAHVTNEPNRVAVRIVVPDLHVELPDSDRDGVQELGPDESVRIGVRRPDAVFIALPIEPLATPRENPTPVDVTIDLKSVWLKKGDLVNAELTGALHVVASEETAVTGRIDLKGGSLDVSGKRFEIERGTVTFAGGDPGNPTISAEARWDAPAGYTVRATYTGTAKKGSLMLRSEPPLTQTEIVNLILFGTPEGSVASGGGNAAEGAVGLAGSTAARGLNRAISDFTRLNVQARVDTSTGSARPELVIPVTRQLSARVTRAIGEPPPGTSPDRTFLTLEFQLKRETALSALLGDRGASALDLVWRRHY